MTPNPWDAVLQELQQLKAEVAELRAWREQVEAVWPQIVEEMTDGTD